MTAAGPVLRWAALRLLVPLALCSGSAAKADQVARFPQSYIEQNRGRASFRIPEVYELSNIILAMSDYGQNQQWVVFKNSAYYQAVEAHFRPFRSHPVFAALNLTSPASSPL